MLGEVFVKNSTLVPADGLLQVSQHQHAESCCGASQVGDPLQPVMPLQHVHKPFSLLELSTNYRTRSDTIPAVSKWTNTLSTSTQKYHSPDIEHCCHFKQLLQGVNTSTLVLVQSILWITAPSRTVERNPIFIAPPPLTLMNNQP